MNRENVEYCIKLMKNAQNLNMSYFQHEKNRSMRKFDQTKCVDTIEELHSCGNTACFAGYVAISPKFKEFGGTMYYGSPLLDGHEDSNAIAKFLDISQELAGNIVYDNLHYEFYPVAFSKVKPEHVIEKLELILSGELK